MWERERARRVMELTDDQYLLAYEALSAAIIELGHIDARDVKDGIELYLGEDAKLLLAQIRDIPTLIRDLAIGPLTGHEKHFTFEHEVLTGYFFARLMARNLKDGAPRAQNLWKQPLYEPSRDFLPETIAEILGGKSVETLLKFSSSSNDGLMLWNIARAIGCALPKDLFKGKDLTGVIFEDTKPGGQLDLREMIFDDSNLHNVVFLRCDLRGAKFHNAKIGHARFIECIPGAIFDTELSFTGDDAEVTLVLAPGQPEETYRTKTIARALTLLSGGVENRIQDPLPANMGERATITIFRSLFKTDETRLDYPQLRKIENSLRAWLRELNLTDDQFAPYMSLFMDLYDGLENAGWIRSNPARTRTKVPCEEKVVRQIIRSDAIPIHLTKLRELVGQFNQRATDLSKGVNPRE
jgi:hypothetical protein